MKVYAIVLTGAALALGGCQNRPAQPDANQLDESLGNLAYNEADFAADNGSAAADNDPAADERAIREMLDRIYAPYAQADAPARDTQTFYAADLAEALRRDSSNPGEVGAVDFDPFISAQDYQAFTPRIGAITIRGDVANAAITYTQVRSRPRNRPPVIETRRIQFTFRRSDSNWGASRGWKVADVAGPGSPSLRRTVGLRPVQ
jgi:hypothetical protein